MYTYVYKYTTVYTHIHIIHIYIYTYIYINEYPRFYIQYGNIPTRASPPPTLTQCSPPAVLPTALAWGGVGWGQIPYGYMPVFDIGYWICTHM